MNQRIECTFWICLALLVLVWGTVFSAGWGIPFAVLGMMVFAAYDFYEQKKNQPIQENDLLESVQCMSPNRFFAAQVIVFVMALTWLDFATGLTALVFFNGILWCVDRFKNGKRDSTDLRAWADVARNYAPLLLAVWLLRSFIIQPYHVPTGSLEPTLLPHELVLVKQYEYGLRFPAWPWFTHTMVSVNQPKRGDIVLFRYPVNERVLLIKRLVGLPGDHIEYKNKQLFINGKPCLQQALSLPKSLSIDHVPHRYHQDMYWEDLAGVKTHLIYRTPEMPMMAEQTSWDVPEGMYFMMGDNRDNSNDSRFWGFVPEKLLIGKGWLVFFSWDNQHHVRWSRVGSKL